MEIYRKMPDASPGTALCASLCSRNAHGHFTRAMLCGNLQENAGCESGHGIVSKRTWTFHKSHVVWKLTGKMPDTLATTSIEHRALTLTARTLQCRHTVWGIRYPRAPYCCTISQKESHQTWKSNTSHHGGLNLFPEWCNIWQQDVQLYVLVPVFCIAGAKLEEGDCLVS